MGIALLPVRGLGTRLYVLAVVVRGLIASPARLVFKTVVLPVIHSSSQVQNQVGGIGGVEELRSCGKDGGISAFDRLWVNNDTDTRRMSCIGRKSSR